MVQYHALDKEQESLAELTEKIHVILPCIEDLQRFFHSRQKEFRDVVYSDTPVETQNQKPTEQVSMNEGGMIEVWITAEQLEEAKGELIEFAKNIEDGHVDVAVLRHIQSRIDVIHELITSRAANLRYFDQWRGNHGLAVSCTGMIGQVLFSALCMQYATRGESSMGRILAAVGALVIFAPQILQYVEQSPMRQSDYIRKRMHAVFEREQ